MNRKNLPKWTEGLSDQELEAEIERNKMLLAIENDSEGVICPNCKTDKPGNVRLSVVNPKPAKWHCRTCLHYWEWEP